MIDCRECRRQMQDLAVESPGFAMTRDMREHMRDCAGCRHEWNLWQETWLLLPQALDTPRVAHDFEENVMTKVHSQLGNSSHAPPPLARPGVWRYVCAIAVAAGLSGVLLTRFLTGTAGRFGTYVFLPHRDEIIEQPAQHWGSLEGMEGTVAQQDLRYVALQSAPAASIQGYFVYDSVSREGHFFGLHMDAAAGDELVVWLLSRNGAVIAAAEIEVTSKHVGTAMIAIPEDASQVQSVLVTAEDGTTNGEMQPSENVLMQATLVLESNMPP